MLGKKRAMVYGMASCHWLDIAALKVAGKVVLQFDNCSSRQSRERDAMRIATRKIIAWSAPPLASRGLRARSDWRSMSAPKDDKMNRRISSSQMVKEFDPKPTQRNVTVVTQNQLQKPPGKMDIIVLFVDHKTKSKAKQQVNDPEKIENRKKPSEGTSRASNAPVAAPVTNPRAPRRSKVGANCERSPSNARARMRTTVNVNSVITIPMVMLTKSNRAHKDLKTRRISFR